MNDQVKDDQDHVANSFAYMESHFGDAFLGAQEVAPFTSPVRITFIHTRSRLADIDGLSGKAVIDGLVSCGILTDDSAKQVQEVNHRQIKGSPESTEVIIEEITQSSQKKIAFAE